ncbi:MAG: protein kinase, partial [Deltaproteobacteria bacterium]|nr:protein kinase [Deltaproteobacteria bacterium]
MPCVESNALAEYLQGLLSPEEHSRIDAHLASCPECKALAGMCGSTVPTGDAARRSPLEHLAAQLPIAPGNVIAGKYRVEHLLGMGGVGVVVAARHLQLEQQVALKFLKPSEGDAETRLRFLREAKAVVRLKSEHVGRVLDFGALDDGAPFIVMELLEGNDLSSVLKVRGPLPVADAVEYLLQALEAVAEAHGLGIVHRDLKPANLFLATRADGTSAIKVLDFGLSKVTGVDSAGLDVTHTTAVFGTPLYMSPEQLVSARSVDARGDLWALGCILYEALAGKTPFGDPTRSVAEVFGAVLHGSPASLLQLRPEVPAELEAVVLRCLEKDREKRFANAAELAVALGPFAPPQAAGYVERVAGVLAKTTGTPRPVLLVNPISPTPRTLPNLTSRWRWPLQIAAAIAIAVAAAWLTVGLSSRSGQPASTPDPVAE